MTRSVDAAVITALAGDFTMVNLLRLGFQTGSPEADTMITDADFDVSWTSGSPQVTDTYTASSHLVAIKSVSENSDIRVGTLSIDLSAVEQTYLNIFLTTDYIDVRARYYRAILDSTYSVIGDAILMFDGNISGYKVSERGDKSILTVECASHWANFDVISGRKTNDVSQQAHFPSDVGMEFASHTILDIKWGRG